MWLPLIYDSFYIKNGVPGLGQEIGAISSGAKKFLRDPDILGWGQEQLERKEKALGSVRNRHYILFG